MLPWQKEIELPLLQVLEELGGEGRPKDIYPLLTVKFPGITADDLAETVKSGGNKWTNRIQWARQSLVSKGEMDSPAWGVWRITPRGRQRLGLTPPCVPEQPSLPSFEELYEAYETAFRQRLLATLHDLSPRQFEQFARNLLAVYGFSQVEVTSISSDGGIDGYGTLRLGLASMRVAFQCKRWQGDVPRPEVDKFRGAIQGEFEQGIFFTTSDFTEGAKGASLKRGAVPIILLNGRKIVDLMIEKGLGVRRVPLYAYELAESDLEQDEERMLKDLPTDWKPLGE